MYLLDTHVLLWLAANPSKLGAKTLGIVSNVTNNLFLSSASVWEISIKFKLGKLSLGSYSSTEKFITDAIKKIGLKTLDIGMNHSWNTENLPAHHSDPFDRMLISQAILENLTIITVDAKIKKYKVNYIDATK